MTLERCAFETERLTVAEWRIDPPADLASRVATVLTATTTSFLPPDWQGDYSEQRARAWIAERDAESPTLLVTERGTGTTVGLVILFGQARRSEAPAAVSLVDVRLGYVLAEAQWGRGFASELVAGLVAWCRDEPSIASIAGGVEVDNVASARVLVKTGFSLVESSNEGGEVLYRLELG
jgi:RimJ/RimL family protein N-acetyltransferase